MGIEYHGYLQNNNNNNNQAPHTAETLASLKEKHPSATQLPSKATDIQTPCLTVDQTAVHRAVMSFPAGSAGGPDGLRPQHLKDLVQCRESGQAFVAALTGSADSVISFLPDNVH